MGAGCEQVTFCSVSGFISVDFNSVAQQSPARAWNLKSQRMFNRIQGPKTGSNLLTLKSLLKIQSVNVIKLTRPTSTRTWFNDDAFVLQICPRRNKSDSNSNERINVEHFILESINDDFGNAAIGTWVGKVRLVVGVEALRTSGIRSRCWFILIEGK